jgi:hypothetical protein
MEPHRDKSIKNKIKSIKMEKKRQRKILNSGQGCPE